ncbi:S-methyl-5-thioribose kinase [Peptoniphilaceae bacterium SGI.131]
MSRFDEYFLMKVEDIEEFVKEKTDFFEKDAKLVVNEIGDGNLNYVFRVVDEMSGKSLIVKHAGASLRIDSSMTASTDRNRIESEILLIQHKQAPGKVPEVYFYDTTMCACIMEDLTGYKMMRTAMLDNEVFPLFADHITDFIVKTQLSTTDVVMNHSEKKELVKSFINPDLCEITEDLVLTEPYNDINGRNSFDEENKAFVEKELYGDKKLSLEVAKLKFNFMNNSQALIHGDLHTGSIFIKPEDTKVFDPEFAFFGPIGYDLGNVIANLEFAWCNGDAKGNREFCEWVENSISQSIDLFIEKADKYIKENATDHMAKTEGFAEWYVSQIIKDTAGYTGTELHRRTIGMAKVKDVTLLEKAQRVRAQKICLLAGKDYIMNSEMIRNGKEFLDVWKRAVQNA